MKFLVFFICATSLFGGETPEIVIVDSVVAIAYLMAIVVNLVMMITAWFLLLGVPYFAYIKSSRNFKKDAEDSSKDGNAFGSALVMAKSASVTTLSLILSVLISRVLFVEIFALDQVYSTSFGGVISRIFMGKAFFG